MAATDVMHRYEVEHIGPAPHMLRNILIALGIFIMAGVIALYYRHAGNASNAAANELGQFRQAMFNRCGGDQFAGPTDPQVAQLYADSSRMRAVVVEQFRLLQREQTRCDDVLKALRSADYPVQVQ